MGPSYCADSQQMSFFTNLYTVLDSLGNSICERKIPASNILFDKSDSSDRSNEFSELLTNKRTRYWDFVV